MASFAGVLLAGLLLGGIYSLVAIGLNLIFGVIRVVNFAQGEFVMLGMYATVRRLHGAAASDPYLALLLVVLRCCSCSGWGCSASSCSRCRTSR